MNRVELINYLIDQRKSSGYLEISPPDQKANFTEIRCAHKTCTFNDISDHFFEHNEERFDIIFIDGLHTEEQVQKDIRNSFRFLTKGGVIILHDCMPPDAWHQRDQEDFKTGENWNGTVWKAVLKYFNSTSFRCVLLDTDWGCGIIDTSKRQLPLCVPLPEKMDFALHYPYLLQYRMSLANYLRENLKVFYHLACMGNWLQVFTEQMIQLKENGFKCINLSVLGDKKELHIVQLICEELNLQSSILFNSADLNYFETPTLLAIEKHVRQNEGHVLYLHSKGVSNPLDDTKVKWRRLMMKELIQNWEKCMLQLPRFDSIGVNWRDMPPISHYCGNFWYASAKYLRKLTDFKCYYQNPSHKIYDSFNQKRLGCEFWISSSAKPPSVLSLAYRNIDFCDREFWRDK